MPAALHWNAAVQVASEGCGWGDSFGPRPFGGIVTAGHGGRGFQIGHGNGNDHCISGGTWAHTWQTRGPAQ